MAAYIDVLEINRDVNYVSRLTRNIMLGSNIEKDIKVLERRGVEMADHRPRLGLRGKRIAFSKSSILKGIPFELSEP